MNRGEKKKDPGDRREDAPHREVSERAPTDPMVRVAFRVFMSNRLPPVETA